MNMTVHSFLSMPVLILLQKLCGPSPMSQYRQFQLIPPLNPMSKPKILLIFLFKHTHTHALTYVLLIVLPNPRLHFSSKLK